MSYRCASCGASGPFSSNQKTKGHNRRCVTCVTGGSDSYRCDTCGKAFRDLNALEQHQQTHRERSFPCPGCGKMYRGMTDTAMHFESGACTSCRGVENARQAAYHLVAGQQGGSNFLTGQRLLQLSGTGDATSGYVAGGENYICPGCGKTFAQLSSMMQHTQNRPQCMARGQHVNLRLGHTPSSSASAQEMRFYHGTKWAAALKIERDGFLPSEVGCLGRGVYVARQDKATRFAKDRARQAGESVGGLVELLVTVCNPKYVISNDYHWQTEGYDACRAERTSLSTNMEWCILSPRQIRVIRVTAV